jgi:hypothetical protein
LDGHQSERLAGSSHKDELDERLLDKQLLENAGEDEFLLNQRSDSVLSIYSENEKKTRVIRMNQDNIK